MADIERTILQLAAIDETGDSYYRMRWPARDLAAQRPNWRVVNLDCRSLERYEMAEHADLLVLYQCQDYDLLPIITRRRAAGRKTIVEYNDNFYSPPPSSPVADAWASPLLWESYETMIRHSDALIVTGEGLRRLFDGRFDCETVALENHLPEPPRPFSEIWSDPSDTIWLGWGGSIGHAPDLLAILPALRDLLAEIPRLRLKVMGNTSLPSYFAISPDRYAFVPWGTMAEYYRFWEGVHLGFAPLLDSPYNRCRSDVKAVEISASGALPILSKLLPYEQFIKRTGTPSYESLSDFKDVVHSLCANVDSMRAQAERCHAYVASERIGKEQVERATLYERMMTAAPSSFFWPCGVGYHELNGTAEEMTRSERVLTSVQGYINAKQLPTAVQAIEEACHSNPESPNLLHARLLLAPRVAGSRIPEELVKARKAFPRDARFLLLQIERERDSSARAGQWGELIKMLEALSLKSRYTFDSGVVRTFTNCMRLGDDMREIGRTLMSLYPDHLQLVLLVGGYYEARGEYAEALECFLSAARIADVAKHNAETVKAYSSVEILSWVHALEGRLKG